MVMWIVFEFINLVILVVCLILTWRTYVGQGFLNLKQAMLCVWIHERTSKDNKNQNTSYSGSSKWKHSFLSKNQIN